MSCPEKSSGRGDPGQGVEVTARASKRSGQMQWMSMCLREAMMVSGGLVASHRVPA